MATKICTRCKTPKPIDGFNRDRSRPDGHAYDCRSCAKDRVRAWKAANRDKMLQQMRAQERQRSQDNRAAIFAHYGTVCACCGSTERLTIDHVHGEGREHRLRIGKGSTRLYRWLVKQGLPDGFQTLCSPCNYAKGADTACPLDHK
jgi:hypothetical protein